MINNRLNTKRTHLGTFTTGELMRVSDPCYDRTVWCTGTFACKPGVWNAYIRSESNGPVWELQIVHESIPQLGINKSSFAPLSLSELAFEGRRMKFLRAKYLRRDFDNGTHDVNHDD